MVSQYFVRSRGRIQGPLELAALQKLVRRGVISRLHEISSDRMNWTPAAEFEELFPTAGDDSPGDSVSVRAATDATPCDASKQSPQPGVPQLRFYYSQAGSTVGPVPLGVLRALAQNGTLGAADMVWQENAAIATPACQLACLAPVYSGVARTAGAGLSAAAQPDAGVVKKGLALASKFSFTFGLTVGVLILLLLNLPVGVIGNRVLWWWNVGGTYASGFLAVNIALLVLGMALCIISPVAVCAARGTLFIVVSAAGAVSLCAGAVTADAPGSSILAVAALYVMPALAGMLSATLRFRARTRVATAGRTCQLTFAILLGVLAFLIAVLSLAEIAGAPSTIVIALDVMLALACATAVASAVLVMVETGKGFSAPLNFAGTVCADVSIALLVASVALACAVAADAARVDFRSMAGAGLSPEAGLMLVVRFSVMFLALTLLAGVGQFELMWSVYVAPLPRMPVSGTSATAEALGDLGA